MSALVVAALALVIYTYAGYPVIAALLARARPLPLPTPSRPPAFEPTVSVCLSIHNGAAFIESKLESLLALDYPAEKLEFLIFSDGSTDDTNQLVAAYARRDPRVRLLTSELRQGKPTALNQLCAAARGEVLLMTDVRQPLSRGAARALVEVLADPEVGCVSGNLELQGEAASGAYWRYEKFIRASEARLGSMVGVSGSIYAIRKADFPELPPDVILDDMWVPLRCSLRRKRVVFCERAVAYDVAFDDDKEFTRKVRTLAGNYQLLARMPELMWPFAGHGWFQMLSHKVLRLLCPWALLVLLAASWVGGFALPPSSPSEQLVLQSLAVGQLAFYLVAFAGPVAGRFGRLARTFVVLNAAALVGLWRFARGEQQVTW